MPRTSLIVGLTAVLSFTTAAAAHAQRGDCRGPIRPSVGVSVGRSSPYFDLTPGAVDPSPSASIVVGGGTQVGARGDLPVVGPLRLRVDGSAVRWNIERRIYSPELNYELVEKSSAGAIAARQIGAAIGLELGRAPLCAHVLIGGALHSLRVGDATLRRPGVSITAGVELPTGSRGKVQMDMQLHVIDTNSRAPISSSHGLAASLMAGWAYTFD